MKWEKYVYIYKHTIAVIHNSGLKYIYIWKTKVILLLQYSHFFLQESSKDWWALQGSSYYGINKVEE